MPEARFQDLSPDDRRDALEVAERSGSHKAHLLEKDVWVVATLGILFEAPFAENLTFKGGTSLSKVWRVSRRFSEDIDITYDIRAFAPDLVSGAGDEALPSTRSQEKRWTRAIRARLAEWVRDETCPIVEAGLSDARFVARCRAEAERLYVAYEPLFETSGFVAPEVIVEFGARSTGEPPHPLRLKHPCFALNQAPRRMGRRRGQAKSDWLADSVPGGRSRFLRTPGSRDRQAGRLPLRGTAGSWLPFPGRS